jgi:hypothetical protein
VLDQGGVLDELQAVMSLNDLKAAMKLVASNQMRLRMNGAKSEFKRE